MKRLIKANPMGFALVIVFLVLIVIGVITTKGGEHQASPNVHAPGSGETTTAPAKAHG